jgi:hypothetical protein
MKSLLIAAAAALSAPAAASPAPAAPVGQEARIPFAAFGGVRNFEPNGREAVYLQDRGRNWYLARLFAPCEGLPWAHSLGIDNRGSGSVDRFSTLLVEGERCQIQSLTRSGPPPKKPRVRHAS